MKSHEMKEILSTLQRIAQALERIARALELDDLEGDDAIPIP